MIEEHKSNYLACPLNKGSLVLTYTKLNQKDEWKWTGKVNLEIALCSYKNIQANSNKKSNSAIYVVSDEIIFPSDQNLGDYVKFENNVLITWCGNWKELQRLKRIGKL